MLATDNTISGKENAAAARAALPDAEAKARRRGTLALDPTTPNETARSIASRFNVSDQDDVLAPYLERYLDAGRHRSGSAWAPTRPPSRSSTSSRSRWPRPTCVARVDAWLETRRRQPGCAALRPRGPRRGGPRAGRPGQGRRARLTRHAVTHDGPGPPRRSGPVGVRGSAGVQRAGGLACSASCWMPRRRPPTRSPSRKQRDHRGHGQLDLVVVEVCGARRRR